MKRIVTSFLKTILRSNKTPYQDPPVNKYLIFIVRAIFSAVFSVVICKMFRPDAQPLFIAGIGIFLIGTSYGFEYYRKKKPNN